MKRFRVMLLAVMMLAVCAESWADVAVNATTFPDEVFRNYVSGNFDNDRDGTLSDEEIAAVTVIDVAQKGITRLNGVEYFTALTELNCADNQYAYLQRE